MIAGWQHIRALSRLTQTADVRHRVSLSYSYDLMTACDHARQRRILLQLHELNHLISLTDPAGDPLVWIRFRQPTRIDGYVQWGNAAISYDRLTSSCLAYAMAVARWPAQVTNIM